MLENADFTPRAQNMPGTAAVVNAVTKEKFAIGYGGAAYAKGIKVLKIKKDANGAGIAPAEATIKDGTYPLSRPLFFYLRASRRRTSRRSPTGCCRQKDRPSS